MSVHRYAQQQALAQALRRNGAAVEVHCGEHQVLARLNKARSRVLEGQALKVAVPRGHSRALSGTLGYSRVLSGTLGYSRVLGGGAVLRPRGTPGVIRGTPRRCAHVRAAALLRAAASASRRPDRARSGAPPIGAWRDPRVRHRVIAVFVSVCVRFSRAAAQLHPARGSVLCKWDPLLPSRLELRAIQPGQGCSVRLGWYSHHTIALP
jgi:hypothetical protein